MWTSDSWVLFCGCSQGKLMGCRVQLTQWHLDLNKHYRRCGNTPQWLCFPLVALSTLNFRLRSHIFVWFLLSLCPLLPFPNPCILLKSEPKTLHIGAGETALTVYTGLSTGSNHQHPHEFNWACKRSLQQGLLTSKFPYASGRDLKKGMEPHPATCPKQLWAILP